MKENKLFGRLLSQKQRQSTSLRQKVSSDDALFQNVSFSWVNKGFEEYLEVTEPEQYDLIHFMHVLYYLNEEMVLNNSYDKFLGSPGCILAAVGTEGDIWEHFIKSFKPKIPSLSVKQPTNIQLSEICARNGWVWETFNAKLDLEITEIFINGDPKGDALLKIFFHINENPSERYGKELMSEILELFREMSREKIARSALS